MSSDDKYIVWQSYTGTWNCGLLRYDYEDADFSELYTGYPTENEAHANRYGGECQTVEFEPHDRYHNDRYDRGAQWVSKPTAGPRIIPDPDVTTRDNLADAERGAKTAAERVERIRWENRNYGMNESTRNQIRRVMAEQDAAEAKIKTLKPVVDRADARMPLGPLYTPEALAKFRTQVEAWPKERPYEQKERARVLAFYDPLIAKAQALQATSAAPGASPGAAQARKPRGVPIGGQFATRERGENPDLA